MLLLSVCGAILLANTVFAAIHCTTPTYDCLPGKPCWPNPDQWALFNDTVKGHLQLTIPLGSPCFLSSPNYNATLCNFIQANIENGTFREEQPGAVQYPQYEACGPVNCDPALAAAGGNCSLGSLSAYYVDAETDEDVMNTILFAQIHHIRIVMRNSGHDLLGRSAAPNTLTLRMFKMKKMEFHDTFNANKCPPANSKNIGVIGAGVSAAEALEYFSTYNMDVTTGGCPTVGISGGYGQGGGHGPLAATYGLMVDNAVEFNVITADGRARTINQCNDPDLFWAIRGGGGGTYAVLTAYKAKLHSSLKVATYHFQASIKDSEITSKITQSEVLKDLWTAVASNQSTWSAYNITGYDIFSTKGIEFFEFLPAAEDPLGLLKNLTAQFAKSLTDDPRLNIIANEYMLYTDQNDFSQNGLADWDARNAPVGANSQFPSRMVSRNLFKSESSINDLVKAALRGQEKVVDRLGLQNSSAVAFALFKTCPTNTPDNANETSANPAWRDCYWHMLSVFAWPSGASRESIATIRRAAGDALGEIKKILPYQAAYTNEADVFEKDWQQVFYGSRYSRLVSIKEKYDPTNFFNVYKGVKWTGENDPMYSCYTDKPIPSVPADG